MKVIPGDLDVLWSLLEVPSSSCRWRSSSWPCVHRHRIFSLRLYSSESHSLIKGVSRCGLQTLSSSLLKMQFFGSAKNYRTGNPIWGNLGFSDASDGKESACNQDLVLIPGSGRSPGGGNGNPLQYSCLENPMYWGPRQATVHGVSKSQTWQEQHSTHDTIHRKS